MIGFLASVKMSEGNPCHPQSDFDVVKERIVISGWQKSKKSVLSVGDKIKNSVCSVCNKSYIELTLFYGR